MLAHTAETRSFREDFQLQKIKSINMEQLKRDLQSTELCTAVKSTTANELEAYVNSYNSTLSALLDKHAPLRTRTRVSRPVVPWYSSEINDAKRSRQKAERKWRRTRLPVDFADFKRKSNKVTNLMNETREEFYSKFIEDNRTDQRKLFCAAKKLLGASDVLNFPVYLVKTMLANSLCAHREDTDSICLSSADRYLVPPDGEASDITDEVLCSFGNLSERNVCELIKASAKNSWVLDPFPTNVVCDSLDVLLPVITNMVNASLSTGYFPDNWKEAIINPSRRALLISLTRTCVRLVISNLCPRLLKEQYSTKYTPMS